MKKEAFKGVIKESGSLICPSLILATSLFNHYELTKLRKREREKVWHWGRISRERGTDSSAKSNNRSSLEAVVEEEEEDAPAVWPENNHQMSIKVA